MEKKFICQSCGAIFSADTNKYVTCPKCGSDNVALKRNSISWKLILGIVVGIIVVIVAALAIIFPKPDPVESLPTPDPKPIPVETIKEKIPYVDDFKDELTWDSIGQPQYNKATKSYTFSVKAKGASRIQYILRTFEGEDVKKTEDGAFANIPGISGGIYIVFAIAQDENKACGDSISQIIEGFEIVNEQQPIEKMTVAQMQQYIDQYDPATTKRNRAISNSVVIVCQGDLGGQSAPTSISQLKSNINMGCWNGVSVVSLGYDSNNAVNKIVVTPILPD